jgi:hypothetical protein
MEVCVKLLLLSLGCLALVAVVMVLVGLFLPRDHVATRHAIYRQPPAALYGAVRSIATLTQWRTGLKSVEPLPDENGRARYREVSGHGQVTYRVLEDKPAGRLVLEIADENLPYGGTWTYEFNPAPTGGTLRITERGFVKNPLFRFLARFVFGHTATMEQYLRDLGRKFQESTEPQP